MMALPAAQDVAELDMDRRPVRLQLEVSPALYRRLLAEQQRRQNAGLPYSLRAILVELAEWHLP